MSMGFTSWKFRRRWKSEKGRLYLGLILENCSDEDKLSEIASDYFGFSEDYIDLRGMPFSNVKLINARFSYCDLAYSSFDCAVIINSHFDRSNFYRARFKNANFSGCDAISAKCDSVLFESCVFEKTSLNGSLLTNSRFKGLVIKEGNFMRTDFSGASFDGLQVMGEVWFKSSVLPKAIKPVLQANIENSAYLARVKWV